MTDDEKPRVVLTRRNGIEWVRRSEWEALRVQRNEAVALLRAVTFGGDFREYQQWCVRRAALLAAIDADGAA